MQLSSFTDYAICILIYLIILPPEEFTHIITISERYNISNHHIINVVHKLGKFSSYIQTVREKTTVSAQPAS